IGVQNSSKDSAVKTDLANAKIAVIAYGTDIPSATAVPTLDVATLGKYGFTKSEFTTSFTAGAAATYAWPSFCIQAPKASDSTKNFKVTDAGGVVDGDC
ncbi:MAG: hypothetical protein KF812_13235, partial [Fimbriimonadaceae bacterium]|nr:hypothetical protein [Fimbriimonadaceae bacterium]